MVPAGRPRTSLGHRYLANATSACVAYFLGMKGESKTFFEFSKGCESQGIKNPCSLDTAEEWGAAGTGFSPPCSPGDSRDGRKYEHNGNSMNFVSSRK